MARCRVEIADITWDIEEREASATLVSSEDDNVVKLSSGEAWKKAAINGEELEIMHGESGNYVELTLSKDESVTVEFTLSDAPDGTYTITEDGQYMQISAYENGSALTFGALNDKAYWDVTNTDDGYILIRSTATGKYVTDENGVLVQTNYTGEDNQKWLPEDFSMTRLTEYREVNVTPDRVIITADGEEIESLTMEEGETVTLSAKVEPEDASATIIWASDSIGSGVVLTGGKLTAYAPGNFNVTATTTTGYVCSLPVKVEGNARDVVKAEVSGFTSADNGYNGDWVPQNVLDGKTGSAYASKDDGAVKYIEFELEKETAVELMYVTGRFTGADGEGAYAKRINGAKMYASDKPFGKNVANAVLVGEVSGVTATSAYVPARVEINTRGEKYKYYTLYFDTVNNGSNISLALDDIAFYTGGKSFVEKLNPIVTAKGGANPSYATDGNVATMFSIETQTNYPNEYIQFELNGIAPVNKIVVKKGLLPLGGVTNYWGDHAYASGCVLEGSLDGIEWETIYTMTKRPDGTDNQSEIVITPENPVAYRYIRYIRKESNSYIGWASNGGNKLILADIEFYTISADVETEVVKKENKAGTIRANSNTDGQFSLITAVFDTEERLVEVVTTPLSLIAETPKEVTVPVTKEGNIKVFTWGSNMLPVADKINVEK